LAEKLDEDGVCRLFCSNGTANALQRKLLEVIGCFKIGKLILTVKYADDLLLLVEEEKVLQGMINMLNEIGVKINVGKKFVMRI
jgi:hypothetical protein